MAEKIPTRRPRRDSTSDGAERSIAEAQRFGLIPAAVVPDDDTFQDAIGPGRERDYRRPATSDVDRATVPFKNPRSERS